MGTVGRELANFINPDLTWNPLAKGYRSAARRTRKPVASSFTVEMKPSDEETQKVGDMVVSDSEKHDVAVLGHSDKVEEVPIKKRRFVFQSPSRPPRFEVLEPNPNGKRQRWTTDTPTTSNVSRKIAGENDSKFDYGDDFLGIEILAAVACNISMLNDDDNDEESSVMEESIREGVASSSPAVPFEETASSRKDLVHEDKMEVSSFQNTTVIGVEKSPSDLVHEDKMEASSLQNSTLIGPQKSPKINDSTTEGSASSQPGRLHIDLNVAWEQPCDILSVDSKVIAVQGCEIHVGTEDFGNNPPNRVVSSDAHGDRHVSKDFKGLPFGTYGSIREESESEACTGLVGNNDEIVAFSTSSAQEPPICDVSDTRVSSQIEDMDACLDRSACLEVHEENRDLLPSGLTIKQSAEAACLDVQGNILCKGSVQVEASNVSSPYGLELEKTCEIDHTILNEDGEERATGAHEDGKSSQDVISNKCQLVAPVLLGNEPGSQAEESVGNQCLPNTGDISASSVFAVGGHPTVTVDAKGPANEASAANATEADSPAHTGSEELMQTVDLSVTSREACRVLDNGLTSGLAKFTTEDPSDDSFESDVYQADTVNIVGNKNNVELQDGYDSQFEDGELRESDACYYWDENEGEDGEVEHVDYGSEFEEEGLCGLDNEKEVNIERSSPRSDNVTTKLECCGTGHDLRNESASPKTRASDVTTDKDFLSGVVGSRGSNGELLSHIEESNAVHQKDAILRSREATMKKFMGRDRAAPHVCGGRPGGHHFVNPSAGYWDSGTCTSGTPRPKSVVESRGYIMAHTYSEAAGIDDYARRQFINPSSNGVYERIIRRRSPIHRDDAYVRHTGVVPVRAGSPIRSRFRRFPLGVTRGIREEYRRSMPEDNIEYSNHSAQRLSRRERSISPFRRGRPYYTVAYKKSWSRSSSRSSTAYLPPREKNEGSRHHSRSPDFRSDARMDRVRLPPQKHFAAEFEEGFMSQTRRRFSTQHPKWLDDRNGALGNFRGRKSPVNMFRQSRRFDSVRPVRRLDSDDQFTPMVRSRKFPDIEDTGRGGENEGSDDDRRKHINRYEVVQRVRRYDTDGVVRRFRYNYDDSNRVTDRRPREVLRRSSEE